MYKKVLFNVPGISIVSYYWFTKPRHTWHCNCPRNDKLSFTVCSHKKIRCRIQDRNPRFDPESVSLPCWMVNGTMLNGEWEQSSTLLHFVLEKWILYVVCRWLHWGVESKEYSCSLPLGTRSIVVPGQIPRLWSLLWQKNCSEFRNVARSYHQCNSSESKWRMRRNCSQKTGKELIPVLEPQELGAKSKGQDRSAIRIKAEVKVRIRSYEHSQYNRGTIAKPRMYLDLQSRRQGQISWAMANIRKRSCWH